MRPVLTTPAARHVGDQVHQHAKGALAAQKALHAIREEGGEPDILWQSLRSLGAEFGLNSVACESFLREIGKRL